MERQREKQRKRDEETERKTERRQRQRGTERKVDREKIVEESEGQYIYIYIYINRKTKGERDRIIEIFKDKKIEDKEIQRQRPRDIWRCIHNIPFSSLLLNGLNKLECLITESLSGLVLSNDVAYWTIHKS